MARALISVAGIWPCLTRTCLVRPSTPTRRTSRSSPAFAFAPLTKDRDVSEDLVQESFLRLVKELNGRSPENVSAWLFRVCANLAVSRGRHLTVRQRFLRVPAQFG